MAIKVEQEASVLLLGTFDISQCERVTAAVGKCPVCGLETAAWKTLTRLLCRVCFPSTRIRFTGLAGEERTGPTFSLQWSHDLSVMETSCDTSPQLRVRSRFNGAMTFQSWKRQAGQCAYWLYRRFNGAMTFQSWKLVNQLLPRQDEDQLQWSHDLSVMETAMPDQTV